MIPTSNHNPSGRFNGDGRLYIFWFLHQTTTGSSSSVCPPGCISFDSYIKPQPRCRPWRARSVVYLLIPTSNHNVIPPYFFRCFVVYLLIPTSNHNLHKQGIFLLLLYIFWFLHQTTTRTSSLTKESMLYIFWFLHQTTTDTRTIKYAKCCISFDSYIKPQLCSQLSRTDKRCISFDSYIKPQPIDLKVLISSV